MCISMGRTQHRRMPLQSSLRAPLQVLTNSLPVRPVASTSKTSVALEIRKDDPFQAISSKVYSGPRSFHCLKRLLQLTVPTFSGFITGPSKTYQKLVVALGLEPALSGTPL